MARPNDYYQQELKKNLQTTPVAHSLPTGNTNTGTNTDGLLPPPQPNLISNIQAEAQKRQTQKQSLGITQEQLDQNIKKSIEKAQYESALVESNRSLSSSLPYELLNTVVRMPDQGYWETSMSTWEKTKYLGSEVPKTLWNMAKAIPRETIKAPLRLSQGVFDLETRILDKLTGYTPGVNPALDELRFQPSYTLPVLGEVKGVGGSYDEGIALGLSPFMSAVKATGEFAGDLAITASMTEAITAAFKPRLATVQKPVTGPDFRPLQLQQLEQIGAKPGQGKLITNELQFGKAAQNPEVSYFSLTNKAATNYKGNANNTFLKVAPAGDGIAKISVVQTRKSLANQTRDFLNNKFGRSKVVEGKIGPELELDSSFIKYDPTAITKLNTTAVTESVGSPTLESILGSMGKKTPAISTAEAYQFYSPNIDEGLTFETALERTKSGNQQLYKSITEDVDKQLGYSSQSINAIGDWTDGAENTILNAIEKVNSYDELKYSAAIKGKIGKQKAVIPFMVNSAGADSLYLVDIPNIKIADLRGKLDELGIDFRTLAEQKDGVKLAVFDPGSQLAENIANLEKIFNTEAVVRKGTGEFLGGETREEGLKIYDEVIKGYESKPNIKKYDSQANQLPVKEKFVDPYTKAKLNNKKQVTATGKGESMELPSVMAKPLKGFENSLVESKQVGQIIGLATDKKLPDVTIQAVTKAITGKDNLYELTQNEAYDVSESIRMFSDAEIPVSDASISIKSFTHPARYWMETAEREFKLPVYSEVFLPMETASRVSKVFKDKAMQEYRDNFKGYTNANSTELRRLVYYYAAGDKSVINNNQSLTPEVKMELSRIGDYTKSKMEEFFKLNGITSKRWFEHYMPQIKKVGGVQKLYKTEEMPKEIKPFFEFEREGSFNPLEDDALAALDIYTSATAKKLFLTEPVKNATIQMEKMPERLKTAVNDYIQEKLGYQDIVQEMSDRFAEKLSKNTQGFIPKDINKQTMDFFMTTSYAGALGLPRIMPLLRDGIQPLITTYPDLGPKWFGYGVKTWAKQGSQELKDKGFLVEMGVPYGAELSAESGRGWIGKTVDFYKRINKLAMKPYGSGDARNRAITYYGIKGRFEDAWNAFNEGKIDYTRFEQEIDMAGFNPTLREVLQKKFRENTDKSLGEAQDLMFMDILDRTQFPYRKGSESRAYYGLKGKLGLQFAQWSHEYLFTLKSWAARGQWDKVIRWYGMSEAIKKSIEESTNVSAAKWIGTGPFSGFPLGPIGKMTAEFIGMINSASSGMDEEVNKNWKDITNTIKIYGGVLTGVGAQKIANFYTSVKRYEEGIAQSTDPDPEKKFGIWSTNGKLIRWVSFSELLQTLMGFESKSGKEQSDRISNAKRSQIEYQAHVDEAMNHLVNGDYDKFDKVVTKNDIMMPDLSTKIKSYVIPLDQRIFERLPLTLKDKYFNAFYPME